MAFEFATATRIIFGRGKFNKIGEYISKYGHRTFIVCGSFFENNSVLREILEDKKINYQFFSINHEPTVQIVQSGVEEARKFHPEFIIGVGGGSALDCGKAISALYTNTKEIFEYLEIIGSGNPLNKTPLPFIAVPTTAGTGAEVTKNAVLESPEHGVKVSLRHDKMFPDLALIDPELTASMPLDVTAFTGMDALTQTIEPYVSKMSNPLTDSICIEGIRRAALHLLRVYKDGNDLEGRENMSLVSLFGGLALANAKLGAVHGFAGPFGGMYKAPHGAVCARLLPFVMKKNIETLEQREPHSEILGRYRKISQLLTKKMDADIYDGINWIMELIGLMDIPRLSKYGFQEDAIPELIRKSKNASSMKGNPIKLTD
ncbi:MAG: iron-containing alcohol dehydrogenase, partial [Anaerolineales bacterium]